MVQPARSMNTSATAEHSLTLRVLSVHSGVMPRLQREMQGQENRNSDVSFLTILTCVDTQQRRLSFNMQFPGTIMVNKGISMEIMTRSTKRTMLSGTLATVLEESAYTVGPPTNDPELREQFDGNLEDADNACTTRVCLTCLHVLFMLLNRFFASSCLFGRAWHSPTGNVSDSYSLLLVSSVICFNPFSGMLVGLASRRVGAGIAGYATGRNFRHPVDIDVTLGSDGGGSTQFAFDVPGRPSLDLEDW